MTPDLKTKPSDGANGVEALAPERPNPTPKSGREPGDLREAFARAIRGKSREMGLGLSKFELDILTDACLALIPDPSAHPQPQADEGGWMPIESAPRDGTDLLLFCVWRPGDTSMHVGHWYPTSDTTTGEPGWTGIGYDRHEDEVILPATRWQPLPQGPDAQSFHMKPKADEGFGRSKAASPTLANEPATPSEMVECLRLAREYVADAAEGVQRKAHVARRDLSDIDALLFREEGRR